MDAQEFLEVFVPFQLVMMWLKMTIEELTHENITPDLQSIIDFDPWQILDWGESVMCQLGITPGEWQLNAIPDIFDCEPQKLGEKIVEYTESISLLRYDLEDIYGEAAASAMELVDQNLIKSEELSAIYDEAPGW